LTDIMLTELFNQDILFGIVGSSIADVHELSEDSDQQRKGETFGDMIIDDFGISFGYDLFVFDLIDEN